MGTAVWKTLLRELTSPKSQQEIAAWSLAQWQQKEVIYLEQRMVIGESGGALSLPVLCLPRIIIINSTV